MAFESEEGYNGIQPNASDGLPICAPAAPLQHYFTLPFALHLRPLPHINFLAYQDSQDTSEAEQSDRGESSLNRNTYRSGRHRLEPTLQPVPPHSLSTISTLLDRTGCLDAVPIWSELISLLDQADEDPNFTNLKTFFDARFDSQGRLISKTKATEQEERYRSKSGSNINLFKRRTHSLVRATSAQGQTPSLRSPQMGGADEISRRGSSVSRRRSNPAAMRTRSKIRSESKKGVKEEFGAVMESDEEGESIKSGDIQLPSPTFLSPHQRQLSRTSSQFTQNQSQRQSDAKYAPEIIMTPGTTTATKNTQVQTRSTSLRPIRFRIRLDLHNVKLAPRPPQAHLSSLKPITTHDLQSSISRGNGAKSDYSADSHAENRLGISPGGASSSDQSHNESLNLYPVTSPDSLRSRAISEESRSDDYRLGKATSRGRDGLALKSSSSQGVFSFRNQSSAGKPRSATRTMTGSSAATTQTSVFGTSSEAGEDSTKSSFGGRQRNLTTSGDKRRPSLLQRFISFGGKRGSSGRRRSNTNSIDQSIHSLEEVSSIDSGTNNRVTANTALANQSASESGTESRSSPVMIEMPGTPSFALAMQSQVASSSDRRSRMMSADHSELSNEEAVDLVDDDGSVGSAVWSNAKYRRKSSVGPMSPNVASLQPVDEDRVFEDVNSSAAEDNGIADVINEGGRVGRGIEEEKDWTDNGDFLSLLRRAAQTTLHLKKDAQKKIDEDNLRTPKSSSTINSLHSPPDETEINDKLKIEALLAPYVQKGHEENADSWWLCGSSDPLPISFACALSQALGWQGIMDLCYGKGSRSEKSEVYKSLSKAAEMNDRQELHISKVRDWVQNVNGNDDALQDNSTHKGPRFDSNVRQNVNVKQEGERFVAGSNGETSDIAPSESASAAGKAVKQGLLSKFMNKKPIRDSDTEVGDAKMTALDLNNDDSASMKRGYSNRSWQAWSDLFISIASWMEEYETCRVRNGMAREMDREITEANASSGKHTDSGFVDASPISKEEERVVYSTLPSFCVPRCVILDALNEDHGFRRRHGIPEGLPMGPDGEEHEDYRWARKKLTSSQFTTSLLLGSLSLSYFFGQMASSDWTYNSAWELDYLEMCVFHSDIISSRFPSPGTSIVPSEQMYRPEDDDMEGNKRAKTCPYPTNNSWQSKDWQNWLKSVESGLILVPAVSFQAWWTLISILNGADGSGRALDLQVKSAEEPFEALDDLNSIYM